MNNQTAFVREQGTGPSVVCLHTSAGSSAQWRYLMDELAPSFKVFAPDFYGDGKSPPLFEDRVFEEDDDIELIRPVLERAAPFHLVGHSYGGAIALRIALQQPENVLSLALYEPALWGLLESNWPSEAGTREIQGVRQRLVEHTSAGLLEEGSKGFIDYWSGAGAWDQTPNERKPAVAKSVRACALKWVRSLGYSVAASQVAGLRVPVLVVSGSRTTEAARSVVSHLRDLLPQAQFVELSGLGHMGPVTHARLVAEPIRAFLTSIAGSPSAREA